MVPQKPQMWSSCKAHDAMEWQRHFERHETPQMGRNCGFWVYCTADFPGIAGHQSGLICSRPRLFPRAAGALMPGWCPAFPGAVDNGTPSPRAPRRHYLMEEPYAGIPPVWNCAGYPTISAVNTDEI
jgi:hypothetical protein